MNILDGISVEVAKKIFGNKENSEKFLLNLQKKKNFHLPVKILTKGKNKGKEIIDLETDGLWGKIVEHWDYENGKDIIRDLFTQTRKYKSGKDSYRTMNLLLDEWHSLNLGDISWPFSQGDFDGFVQRINSENINGSQKDKKVRLAAVKYRRIKEINTVRNDFIETLIFEKNKNIIPTLNHRRGIDFFINGESFDQKVAKSPTNEFIKDFGKSWKEFAIHNPDKVAQYLYKYQDEGRFSADNRLLVVYLDEDISIKKIAEIIENSNLENPLNITFDYTHNKGKPSEVVKSYKVSCFIILLNN